jgi:hypothetical protein
MDARGAVDANHPADAMRDAAPEALPDAASDVAPDETPDAVADVSPDAWTSRCDPASGPVVPTGTDDVTYPSMAPAPCFNRPCLCDRPADGFLQDLLACRPASGGIWGGQGSVYVRTTGRSGGRCLVEVSIEVEGGLSMYRCALPLPMSAWSGLGTRVDGSDGDPGFLAGIESDCEQVGSCCTIPGCPVPCAALEMPPPQCPPGSSLACD